MSRNELIYASSETDADVRYLTSFLAPDPFVYLKLKGQTLLLLSDLEVGRGQKEARVKQVLSLSALQKKYKKRVKDGSVKLSDMIVFLCGDAGVKQLTVPTDFPLGLARALEHKGLKLEPSKGLFVPGRLCKTAHEIKCIKAVQRANEAAMHCVQDLISLAVTRGKNRILYVGNEVLTSERVRREIDLVLLDRDCVAEHSIIACGKHCADPHNRGSGPLYAGQSIIVDIFPRSKTSGYFADMTRTFCKDPAPEKLKKLYAAVQHAQALALKNMRAGLPVKTADQKIRTYFDKAGYKTRRAGNNLTGFFHGTGHGVGLEIHEAPSLSPRGEGKLKSGMVVTVEPGLYYPWGGVRLEDMALVTKTGVRNLTNFPKVLEV